MGCKKKMVSVLLFHEECEIFNKVYFPMNFRTCVIDVEAVMIAKGLHYFNSVLNPIIYSQMNKQFKSAFKNLFHLTFYNLSNRWHQTSRAEIDRQHQSSLSTTRFSSLKSRSSKQEKTNCIADKQNSAPKNV